MRRGIQNYVECRIKVPSKDIEKYKLQDRDILIVRSSLKREGVAYPALFVEDKEPVVFCGFLIRIRPNGDKIDPFYLLNYLRSSIAREKLVGDSDTVTITNIDQGTLLYLDIPLPSLSEQKHISAKIQELMQEIERARTACEKQLEAAKSLPAAYLREVFESEEAKKWERKRLGEAIAFIKNGIVAEQNFDGSGFPVTRIETISNGFINSEKIGWANLPVENFTDFRLCEGDILFSHINSVERLGNCAIYEGIPKNLYHGMNLLRIKAKENILDPYFLLFWLRSDVCKNYYITNARRAIGQASLNQSDIKQIPIHLPALHIQHRIASELNGKMLQVEKLQSAIRNQQSALDALPQAILRKALRGEL